MPYKIDFSIATSEQIAKELCQRLASIRLMRNLTQAQLARKAGISLKTLGRLEKGQDVSLDTFIRVLMALGIQENLQTCLPDPAIRPVERTKFAGAERKRARPPKNQDDGKPWTWGDEPESHK